ncbi:inositol monophosphatase family protein [Kaistia granuli]|uniref:inositol monophosphatase family protein n=1 Tax=Kaistia granuli TaxID=363259 RepID=UPI0003AACF2C|nr:inositol monophosphatase [Kaistia granuli]
MTLSIEQRSARLALAREVAREAGALALSYFERLATLAVEFKQGGQDVVSIADREVEVLIRARIAEKFPEDGVLGEEDGLVEGQSGVLWVVDPIDGTSPFLNGLSHWCISIAVAVEGEAEIGVIYAPVSDEFFSAAKGMGAFLNDAPIAVAPARSIEDGLLGFGSNHRIPPADVGRFITVLLDAGGMFYRNGSGALMLAYVACGRLVGYYEQHINSWDCLAGLCLIREAGGWHNDFLAGEGMLKGNRIAGGAPQMKAGLIALLERAGASTETIA